MKEDRKKRMTKWPLRLLRLFYRGEYLEEIAGDVLERFERRVAEKKAGHALLWLDVLTLLRPQLLRRFHSPTKKWNNMLAHNIKVSLRSFKKHKTSFFINYVGLVGGLVSVLFIYLWVHHELRVDRFHAHDGQLYRLVGGNANTKTLLNTNPYFAWELEESIPEVDYVVNSCWGSLYSWLATEENSFATRGEFGSSRFFELFSYPLLTGDASTVLEQPNAIVLSERMALKLFKTTEVIGEQLTWRRYSHEEPVVVTGIFKDLPKSSSEQFEFVLNFKVYEKRYGERLKRGRQARTFLKLREGATAAAVNQKIHDYTRAAYPEDAGAPMEVIDFAGYYLENQYENGKPVGGRLELIRLFSVIGLLILIVACINFMNLSTARAALRTKEIGVRKTMGALRASLIKQYLTESCLISLVAGLTAIGLFYGLLPLFERMLDQPIHVRLDLVTLGGIVGIILFTGVVAGSYPALYLSGFKPLKVLQGTLVSSAKDQWLRKGLVVSQFAISLVLIVSVIAIYQQMQFIQTKNLGYQGDYLINFRTTGMSGSKQKAFLEHVWQVPGVVHAAGISHALFGAQRSGANMTWEGKDPEQEVWFEYGYAGYDLLELLEIELHEGRFFSRAFGDETSKVVINKVTKDLMGVETAIGKKFTVGEREYEIIGVTENFHFESLHEEIKPTFFLLNEHFWHLKMAIRLEPTRMREALSQVEDVYRQFNPGFPFQYAFHDQDQAERYAAEAKISTLTKYAAGLAILISSLGLFGLVSFVTERKSKELGIRKVLGASTVSIAGMLSKDFLWPMIVASVVGTITATLLMEKWLEAFAYRITLEWWFFGGAIFAMLLIALITSLSQLVKTVNANPIQALRDE